MGTPWRPIKGAEPDAIQVARPVLNGGDEETGLLRPRLVATQLRRSGFQARLSRSVMRPSEKVCMNNVILYLMGFAGTGKLTIAKAILARSPFLLVDNHCINNVVFSLIDTDGNGPLPPSVWENVGKVRSIVFNTIRYLSKPARNFVLTNVLVEGDDEDEKVFQEVRALATARGAAFLPVRLIIAPEELARRVVSPQRQALLKSRNPDEALRMAREHQVYIPKDEDYVELEVTKLSPADAAEQILAEVRQRFRL